MDSEKGELETPSLSSAMAKTTTISTIAVQSGKTRIVIALLHCGNWLQLKILEITPALTKLGASLIETLELQKAHDEVLRQLQNKQSPVEELLRQADQLIATQKPRAEVYAAMAETLGKAWRDINYNLELRKHILDLNVQYHTKAGEFFDKTKILEEYCTDTVVPIEIEAVKQFLTTIHDLRRTLLESLMAALQAGNSLLGKLKALGSEGTLDSRPDHIRQSVNKALSQVQTWLDELHVKRQDVEAIFNRRKLQLEQCLALAILAADLRELEDCVNNCRNRLANADQLGDSAASTELLLLENKRLLPEAQLLQEKALKITKATEQLLASGCFAGEDATKQSYAILSMTSDYMTELQNRNNLLERVMSFFRSSQAAFNNLDQLETELTSSNLKHTSSQLSQIHAQCSETIEEITAGPIADGYSILESVGRGSTGTDGVKRTVEELENVKIRLDALCVAHREENLRINRALDDFMETYSSIHIWLSSIAEAFLQSHQDMGTDLSMANDFMDLHRKLLNDLQDKGNEINSLLLTVLPPIVQYLDDDRRRDVDMKVDELRDKWTNLKNILKNRLDLGKIYVKFHTEADIVNKQIDNLEDELRSKETNIDDETLKNLEIKWESLEPLYQSAKNTGLTFINDARKVSEPHLDTNRACACVETVLERLSERQLRVTRTWQTIHSNVIETKELLVKLEETIMESTKTINWVTKLESQLYPVITTTSNEPNNIAIFLENKLETILPDITRAQNEVEHKIRTAEALIAKTRTTDEKAVSITNRLSELSRKLSDITDDYKCLVKELIAYFASLHDFQDEIVRVHDNTEKIVEITDINRIQSMISEYEISRNMIHQNLNRLLENCDTLTRKILKQEPPSAASQDIEKLRHTLEIERSAWETKNKRIRDTLDTQCTFCRFDEDLNNINRSISNLEQQNQELRRRYGQSIDEAKASSIAYATFERTIQDLDKRIGEFIGYGERLLSENHIHAPLIEKHISELRERWSNFRKQIQQTRHLIDLSIQYFGLIQEAAQWFKEGERLLVSIARRSALVKKPEEAEQLLQEISTFLKPGEEKQNDRIRKISELAKEIYGPALPTQLEYVVDESREMIKSFSLIREELDTLSRNLLKAEQEKLLIQKEQEEAASKLAAAREEALAQEEARAAAGRERIALEEESRRIELEIIEKQRQSALRAEQEKLRIQKEQHDAVAKLAAARAEAVAQEEARAAAERKKIALEEESKRILLENIEKQRQSAWRAEQEEMRLQKEQEEAAAKLAATKAKTLELEEARAAAEKEKIALEEKSKRIEMENLEIQRQSALKLKQEGLRLQKEQEDAAAKLAATRAEALSLEKADNLLREEAFIEKNDIEYRTQIIREVQTVKKSTSSGKIAEIMEAPRFITPLADAIIQEGSKFSFICQVLSNPAPLITWYKSGVPIQNNPDYRTHHEEGICTLTIEETFSDDSARYTCRALNTAGIAETSASLTVKETEPQEQLLPPSFTRLLEPACIKEGSSFEFHCNVEGNPLPNVQWFKNQECIDYAPGYHITYNNGNAILKIEKVDLKDKAEYTCKASNQCGSAQSSANLIITPMIPTQPPSIILPLSNVMARAGQKIKLECEITGLPTPDIVWLQNGFPLEETRELKLEREGDRATLVIYEAFPKDAGNYKVTASNIAGEASSVCSVSVKGRLPNETSDSEIASDMEPVKPSIQLPLTDVCVIEGSRVRLDCVIVGQPEPEVIWYHDDRPVKESSDFQLLFQGDRCSLVIQEALSGDAGEYRVVALNSAGEASSKCSLSIKPTTTSTINDSGTARTIPVGYPPKFNELLTDVLVSEGEQVIFEGNVIGQPIPEIKWLLNNLPITPNDNLKISHNEEGHIKLEIKEVQPQDKGVYTVKAINEHGEAKCFAQLIVKSSKAPETIKYEEVKSVPVFTEKFSDKTAFENTPSKFECIVVGKPKPRVKWLFRGEPISGTNFLVSTSGDRQVLSIPNTTKDTEGTIACIAENEMGTASCAAQLSVHSLSTIFLPSPANADNFMNSSFSLQREVHTESSTKTSSSVISSGVEFPEPQTKIHSFSSHSEKHFRQVNKESPEISESHNVEEYLQLGNNQPIIDEKSSSSFSNVKSQDGTKSIETYIKPTVRSRAPKFTTPVIGKIVDQNTTVVLEGILDGLPTPTIVWTKNGTEISFSEKISAKWEFNKASLEIKETCSNDAGRYTCTAMNDAGTAISTADLVVRKTIFPPVFGRRLQAQVIKKGDRIIMEVEVTGTPEPSISWYKDSVPVEQALTGGYKIKSCGSSHSIVIERGDLTHSGRYMVKALNSGGEAQSIADIAVFEPTPDTMVEVVKTVVFEDVRKHETLELTATPIITNVTTEKRNESYEIQRKMEHHSRIQQQSRNKTIKCPPPPSPSKFVKGEFRESDYESDYDKPISKIWKPSGSEEMPNFRPVRPVLTPTGRQSQVGRTPTPPTQFEEPSKLERSSRPKFEPIEKPLISAIPVEISKPEVKSAILPLKPTIQTTDINHYIPLRPGTPPELAYANSPQTVQFYRSTTSMPYHNAVQTETSNKVHFRESTEKCHRTVSLEQSTKVIKFGDKQTGAKVEPYSESKRFLVKAPPPTTPKKFAPGEFRESDYESDAESIRIKPKWAPSGSDTEDLHYRPVRPPSSASRSSSVPPSRERVVTPMEFDKYPSHKSIDKTDSEIKTAEWSMHNNRYPSTNVNLPATRSRSYEPPVKEIEMQPGSPPEYGFISDSKFKSKASSIASHHMDNMTQQFKSKTQKFVRDIMSDADRKSTPKKSILKNGEDRDAQVYREETRAAQYGTKHVDPDTGLIYFKYDFGYEFGIVLPGESKNGGIPERPETIIEPPKRTRDIEMPVYHESSQQTKQYSNEHVKPKLPKNHRNIKWEPTSESELSEYEGNSKINQGLRWGNEKHRMTDTPPSCPGTPVNANKAPPGQVRAPMFITPLRNIAVLSGQNAKFECIVQSEPSPSVLWSKNGRIIEDSHDYQLHYRNGVCRLTICRAYPEDAGTFTCTATNIAGTASTTAVLDVPGELKSAYIK